LTEVFSIKLIRISIQPHMKLFKALSYTVLLQYSMFVFYVYHMTMMAGYC